MRKSGKGWLRDSLAVSLRVQLGRFCVRVWWTAPRHGILEADTSSLRQGLALSGIVASAWMDSLSVIGILMTAAAEKRLAESGADVEESY